MKAKQPKIDLEQFRIDMKIPEDLALSIRAIRALDDADADEDSAVELLGIAADFLRRGWKMPDQLAAHLANAFEVAISRHKEPCEPKKRRKLRDAALLSSLKITVGHRRPTKLKPVQVGWAMEKLISSHPRMGPTKRFNELAGKAGVSPQTIAKLYAEYEKSKMEGPVTMKRGLHTKRSMKSNPKKSK